MRSIRNYKGLPADVTLNSFANSVQLRDREPKYQPLVHQIKQTGRIFLSCRLKLRIFDHQMWKWFTEINFKRKKSGMWICKIRFFLFSPVSSGIILFSKFYYYYYSNLFIDQKCTGTNKNKLYIYINDMYILIFWF